ncbi:MAG: ABC transporter permease [Deltaproteobacteria bacterium]|jgi:ABC-type lipoprotein release transport system permease subunit|nr:ABC transporter permease [Deltaproteobacteria bacterium]
MLFGLAYQNLWRNRRRTLLTMSAMVVSVSLLILALGIFSGMFKDMLASATEQYYGHLVMAKPDYHQRRDLYATLPNTILTLPTLQNPEILGRAPRLRSFGLVSWGQTSQPVELLGIQPLAEATVTSLHDQIVKGRFLEETDKNCLIIGWGLAEKLNVRPGDAVVFVTQAADGSIGNDLLTITGIFRTGDRRHDNNLVLAPLTWLQNLLVLPGRIHEVSMRIHNPMTASVLASRINAELNTEATILDWGELLPEMREVISAYDVSRMIVVIILYLATGLGILNTFFMSVMERTREFGILLAQGMRPWLIRQLVLLEAMILAIMSLIIGMFLGGLMTFYMDQVGIDLSKYITPVTYAGGTILPRLHAVFDLGNFLTPAIVLLMVSLAASYLPANRAAKLNPVVAIREE